MNKKEETISLLQISGFTLEESICQVDNFAKKFTYSEYVDQSTKILNNQTRKFPKSSGINFFIALI